VQGRFLLKPTDELNSIVIGILARAQRLYPVEIHAFVFLSNHYHLLLSVDSALELAQFMNYLNSNLAREAGRIYGWSEKFWGRRYQAIVITLEEAAQVDRLRYLLSHGCKEGLVARPEEWPGAQCVNALTEGQPLSGLWFDRTKENAARSRGEPFHHLKYTSHEEVELDPLPCWHHLSETDYRQRVRELVSAIEAETASRHVQQRSRPLGVKAILCQKPHHRPQKLKKALAPLVHAATKEARTELVEAYRWFVITYREATDRLKMEWSSARFPRGCFPPRPPFVTSMDAQAPG
jgi:REP element-mobilizing transposase RayT